MGNVELSFDQAYYYCNHWILDTCMFLYEYVFDENIVFVQSYARCFNKGILDSYHNLFLYKHRSSIP